MRVTPASVPEPRPARGGVAVVVPVHGALDRVESCLRSVIMARGARHPIVVVDDASPDTPGLRDLVSSVCGDRAVLVHHARRRGYSAAVDTGVAAASRLGVAAVLILNSDTVVLRDSIHWLERALFADPGIGAVGPLSNAAGRQSLPGDRRSTLDRLLLRAPINAVDPALLERASSEVIAERAGATIEVSLLHGFAMLVRLRAFDEVGGLDVRRFPSGYGSETDLSFRLRDRGWSLRVATASAIWHAGSGSTSSGRRWAGVVRGRLALGRLHGGRRLRAARRETARSLALRELRRSITDVLEGVSVPGAVSRPRLEPDERAEARARAGFRA